MYMVIYVFIYVCVYNETLIMHGLFKYIKLHSFKTIPSKALYLPCFKTLLACVYHTDDNTNNDIDSNYNVPNYKENIGTEIAIAISRLKTCSYAKKIQMK